MKKEKEKGKRKKEKEKGISSKRNFILVVGRSCQDYCLYYSLVSR
jgi:hypothetical protein